MIHYTRLYMCLNNVKKNVNVNTEINIKVMHYTRYVLTIDRKTRLVNLVMNFPTINGIESGITKLGMNNAINEKHVANTPIVIITDVKHSNRYGKTCPRNVNLDNSSFIFQWWKILSYIHETPMTIKVNPNN